MLMTPTITAPEGDTARVEFGAFLPFVEVFALSGCYSFTACVAKGSAPNRSVITARKERKVLDAGAAFWGRR